MPDASIGLVLPGDPFVFPEIEQEPVRSRYTGRMLRRVLVGVRARDDQAGQELVAALQGTGGGEVLIPDTAGGHWKVLSTIIGEPASIHDVEIVEHEELDVERVEFEGLSLVPDRWSLGEHGEAYSLAFLATMDSGTHGQFEQVLERRQAGPEAERYFTANIVGITVEPVSVRFGQCLWQRLDGGGARHFIVLVSEQGDVTDPDPMSKALTELLEPQRTRLMQQSVIVDMKLDALIEELRRAGVLGEEAVARITQRVDRLPFARMREFERVGDVEFLFD